MALFKTRKLKKETAKKKAYLDYYKKTKKQGKRPQPYGVWTRTQRALKDVGAGRKTRRQAGGLSPGDAAAIEKMLRKK